MPGIEVVKGGRGLVFDIVSWSCVFKRLAVVEKEISDVYTV